MEEGLERGAWLIRFLIRSRGWSVQVIKECSLYPFGPADTFLCRFPVYLLYYPLVHIPIYPYHEGNVSRINYETVGAYEGQEGGIFVWVLRTFASTANL